MRPASVPSTPIQVGRFTLRRATPSDVGDLVRLGLKGLAADPLPGLVIDREKVEAVVRSTVSDPASFAWVSELDGEVVGAVMAMVHDQMFHERKQASVIQFWAEKPGAGAPLIRHFLRWARGRPVIKSIVFTLECHADPRIGKLLARMGLRREHPVYMETR